MNKKTAVKSKQNLALHYRKRVKIVKLNFVEITNFRHFAGYDYAKEITKHTEGII
jgi:hypothetical protein